MELDSARMMHEVDLNEMDRMTSCFGLYYYKMPVVCCGQGGLHCTFRGNSVQFFVEYVFLLRFLIVQFVLSCFSLHIIACM